jgi:hypothetical protein
MEFSVYKAKGFMPERELSNGELRLFILFIINCYINQLWKYIIFL